MEVAALVEENGTQLLTDESFNPTKNSQAVFCFFNPLKFNCLAISSWILGVQVARGCKEGRSAAAEGRGFESLSRHRIISPSKFQFISIAKIERERDEREQKYSKIDCFLCTTCIQRDISV